MTKCIGVVGKKGCDIGGALRRLATKCRECPFADKCNRKKIEAEGYLEPVAQNVSMNVAMPVARETMQIVVDGVLTTVYKDDIQKQIEQHLFKDRFLRNGA